MEKSTRYGQIQEDLKRRSNKAPSKSEICSFGMNLSATMSLARRQEGSSRVAETRIHYRQMEGEHRQAREEHSRPADG
jgi:hypothetical protein